MINKRWKVIEFINHENNRFRVWRKFYISRESAKQDINATPDVKKTLIVPVGHTLLTFGIRYV